MKRAGGVVAVAVSLFAAACHDDAPCNASLGAGAHLQLDVLEETSPAPSDPECGHILAHAGDELLLTTGQPYGLGADGDCKVTSAEAPPSSLTDLSLTRCEPQADVGAECLVQGSACSSPPLFTTALIGDDQLAVGQSREMRLTVRYASSVADCPKFSCNFEFRVQVTRLD